MDPKLPRFLEIRDVPNQGKGIYTTKSISRGQSIFSCLPYSFGIGGITIENVRGSCHNCLAMVKDLKASIVCSKCNVAGYCSKKCLKSAQPLHRLECEGLAKIEQLRGRYPAFKSAIDGHLYWPPKRVLMIARAINRNILQGASDSGINEWMKQLAGHKLPPSITDEYLALLQELVHNLVPDSVKDVQILQAVRAVYTNSTDVPCPSGTSAGAFYFEFSLLNHMCYPNCDCENDGKDVSVYALQDIECGSQLGISYLNSNIRVYEREMRRNELKELQGFDCHCYVCVKEKEVGSEYWRLDQQKRSLIAPWSRKTADKIMKNGWKLIRDSEHLEPEVAIKQLESEFEVQKLVLDKVNITLILTALQLVRNYYFLLPDRRGVRHLKSLGVAGMNAFFRYSTAKEIVDFGNMLSKCFNKMDLITEARKIGDLMLQFFPMSDTIRMAGLPPTMMHNFKEYMLQQKSPEDEVQQIVSYVMNICSRI